MRFLCWYKTKIVDHINVEGWIQSLWFEPSPLVFSAVLKWTCFFNYVKFCLILPKTLHHPMQNWSPIAIFAIGPIAIFSSHLLVYFRLLGHWLFHIYTYIIISHLHLHWRLGRLSNGLIFLHDIIALQWGNVTKGLLKKI